MKRFSTAASIILALLLMNPGVGQTQELANLGVCGAETCLEYRGQQNFAAGGSRFGASVDCRDLSTGDEPWTVLVGAPEYLSMGEVYLVDPLNPAAMQAAGCGYGTTGDQYGAKVAFTRDLDTDLASTWGVLAGNPYQESVFVCSEATGKFSTATSEAEIPGTGFGYGKAFCDLGDIGRYDTASSKFVEEFDGIHEILLGGPATGTGRVDIYSVYMDAGSATTVMAPVLLYGDGAGDALGMSVICLPDLNADGLPEFAAGAPYHDEASNADAGQVKLYSVSYNATYLEVNHIASLVGSDPQVVLGNTLARAGDVDLDGHEDLLVGMKDAALNGKVALFSGQNFINSTTTPLCEISVSGDDSFGHSLVGLGDPDGDGKGEFVVGAPSANSEAGMLYFYEYDLSAPVEKCVFIDAIVGPLSGYRLGESLAACKILGDDDLPDLVVGTERNIDAAQAGSVAFFAMKTPAPTPTPQPTAEPTVDPTAEPTVDPTVDPTAEPSSTPRQQATPSPLIVPPAQSARPKDLKGISLPQAEVGDPNGGDDIEQRVTVFLPELVDLEEQGFLFLSDLRELAKAKGGKNYYRFKIKLVGTKANGKKVVRQRVTKKNSLTFSKLGKGDYRVKYKLQLVKKKKVAAQTSYSPSKSFSSSGRTKG